MTHAIIIIRLKKTTLKLTVKYLYSRYRDHKKYCDHGSSHNR